MQHVASDAIACVEIIAANPAYVRPFALSSAINPMACDVTFINETPSAQLALARPRGSRFINELPVNRIALIRLTPRNLVVVWQRAKRGRRYLNEIKALGSQSHRCPPLKIQEDSTALNEPCIWYTCGVVGSFNTIKRKISFRTFPSCLAERYEAICFDKTAMKLLLLYIYIRLYVGRTDNLFGTAASIPFDINVIKIARRNM